MPRKPLDPNDNSPQAELARLTRRWLDRRQFGKDEAFAAAIGMHKSQLSRIINGKENATLETLRKMAVAFGVGIAQFYADEDPLADENQPAKLKLKSKAAS